MISRATKDFWKGYDELPKPIKDLANKAYKLFQEDPSHPSLHFKKVTDNPIVYSVRISIHYRALGVKEDDTIIWFWIGNHTQYEKQIASL